MAMEKYLIVNPGSASKKYALFNNKGEKLISFHFEKEGKRFIATTNFGGRSQISIFGGRLISVFAQDFVFKTLIEKNIIIAKEEIITCGVRIVAPGKFFAVHRVLDNKFLAKLKEANTAAPLHIGPALEEIRSAIKFFPKAKIIAVSDSAFYDALPLRSKFYGLPVKDCKKFGIYRFGYHGISMTSILNKLKSFGRLPERIIVCHLGGGVTVSAVKKGLPIDPSMGFTPLEGALMATRPGDIDAGAVLYLAKKKKFNFEQLENYLNKECGLLGLSGLSSDIRELLAKEKKDKNAKLALEIFVYRLAKYIGSYIASLGGLDILIFSATIGERARIMRDRICRYLEHFGVVLDPNKNKKMITQPTLICHDKSKVKIAVTPTDEMTEMYRVSKSFSSD